VNPRWTRLWFASFVVIVFAAGIGTGMVIDRRFGPPPRPMQAGRGPGRGMGGGLGLRGGGAPPRMLADRMSNDLKLTTDQRTRVEQILAARRTRMEQFSADVRARFETEQRDLHAELRAVLNADQQKQFDEWIKVNPMGGPPGRRGGGPGRGGRGPF
jgi:hypothetical protein